MYNLAMGINPPTELKAQDMLAVLRAEAKIREAIKDLNDVIKDPDVRIVLIGFSWGLHSEIHKMRNNLDGVINI